jgi:hypothetical protein
MDNDERHEPPIASALISPRMPQTKLIRPPTARHGRSKNNMKEKKTFGWTRKII